MNPIEYLETLILAQQNYEQGKSELPVQVSELKMLMIFIQSEKIKR